MTGDRSYFFWTGSPKPGTVPNHWRQRLGQIAEQPGVQGFRTHRLRDTLAVELLLADVSIEDVSALLGHSSVPTTEKHYVPWGRSRRDRSTRTVRDTHRRDPLLEELYPEPALGPAQASSADHPSAHGQDSRPIYIG